MSYFNFKTSKFKFFILVLTLSVFCSAVSNRFFCNADSDLSNGVPSISDSYLRGIGERTTCEQLKSVYTEKIHGSQYRLRDIDGNIINSSDKSHYISTGDYIEDGMKNKYTVVVTGDIDGNGKIAITDTVALKMHFSRTIELQGANYQAADSNNDSRVTATDYIRIKFHIQQKYNIHENEDFSSDDSSSDGFNSEEDDWTSGWL